MFCCGHSTLILSGQRWGLLQGDGSLVLPGFFAVWCPSTTVGLRAWQTGEAKLGFTDVALRFMDRFPLTSSVQKSFRSFLQWLVAEVDPTMGLGSPQGLEQPCGPTQVLRGGRCRCALKLFVLNAPNKNIFYHNSLPNRKMP